MSETVIEYVLRRLKDIGVDHIFGVAGDYAFPIDDAIVKHSGIEYVACCNELNAGYAADGYARVHGVGAICTTYGVGELSAINAVAGSCAENVPVIHITSMPAMPVQKVRAPVHHTLGNGEFELFKNMADIVVHASAILSPQNAAYETERLIAAALHQRGPVYMAIPSDLADKPVASQAQPIGQPFSDRPSLDATVAAITDALGSADTACVLPGILTARLGLRDAVQSFIDASGLPFATMFGDKSVLNEQQGAYIGMYDGRLMDPDVRALVESCDQVVCIGTMLTDFNSGAFTSNLDQARTIDIGHHHTRVGSQVFTSVEMGDVLSELSQRVSKRPMPITIHPATLGPVNGDGDMQITAEALYPRWERFFKPDDIIISETGSSSLGLAFAHLPKGAQFHNQTLWGSIGWATPAAFGAAVAAPGRRVILVTGDGSHQLTAQEISQFGRRGMKPIVFVLNNNGYLIERMLCKDGSMAYNDIAPWNYTALPHALGCNDWYTARVTNCGELDEALKSAEQGDKAAYIEVVTDTYAAPPLVMKLHENIGSLYSAHKSGM
ncbi:MAG TPA: thiamine pyrophosphate-binding protein [Trebonia sp.]|jgi:indolepyruvate decarboxylase|nr:thiamine pyrophosphate-binding protein [Trebonia sp.]